MRAEFLQIMALKVRKRGRVKGVSPPPDCAKAERTGSLLDRYHQEIQAVENIDAMSSYGCHSKQCNIK